MNSHIDEYTDFMENIRHKSQNTVESYTRDVNKYLTYLGELGITEIESTTKTTVRAYMASLSRQGRAPSTLSRTLASLRSYYIYLKDEGFIKIDPTESVAAPHITKHPPRVLSDSEIDLLLDQPKLANNKGIRDKAMLELLYATGIRVSELIGLDMSDLNLKSGYIRCRNSKNERVIPMGQKAVDALCLYVDKARKQMIKDESEGALFVNCGGARISRQGFWKIIKQYRDSSGIDMDITPHSLRHSFAAHLIENGADLQSLKTMMGHIDISSTQVYSCFLDEKIRAVYQSAHPRAV